jgi:hypothetical protein
MAFGGLLAGGGRQLIEWFLLFSGKMLIIFST